MSPWTIRKGSGHGGYEVVVEGRVATVEDRSNGLYVTFCGKSTLVKPDAPLSDANAAVISGLLSTDLHSLIPQPKGWGTTKDLYEPFWKAWEAGRGQPRPEQAVQLLKELRAFRDESDRDFNMRSLKDSIGRVPGLTFDELKSLFDEVVVEKVMNR